MMDFSLPQRQSIAALLNIVVQTTKTTLGWAWFIYVSILFKQNDGAKKESSFYIIIITIAILLFIIIRSIIEWMRFTFHVHQQQFIINKGIITKNQLIIPLEKIQTVHIEQHIWHKLTATCKIIIDTAGTNKAELTIHALSIQAATNFKALLLQKISTENNNSHPNHQTLLSLQFTDLLKLSFSANHLETFFIIFFFALGKLDEVGKIFDFSSTDWLIEKTMEQQSDVFSWKLFCIGITIVLIFSVAASVVRMFIRYFQFLVIITNKGFEASWGLIQHKQEIIPLHKIQYIHWRSNWIRRKIGLYLLQLKAVGEDELKKHQKIQIPITQLSQIQTILSYYQPNRPSEIVNEINTVHKAYFWRFFYLVQIPLILIAMPFLFIWIHWYSLLLFILLFYWLIAGLQQIKNFQYWITESAVEIVSGFWGRNYTLLNWKKVQVVTVTQSLYQKRKQLATLEMHTASGTVKLPYISFDKAKYLADYITVKIEMVADCTLQNQENAI
ncbi:MAG: PH domain-containing protein [Chitinophagaceae bacterium]